MMGNFPLCLLLFVLPHLSLGNDGMTESSCQEVRQIADGDSPLLRARAIGQDKPAVSKRKGGEFEGHEFWDRHDALFREAWTAYPRLHPELYHYNSDFKKRFIHPALWTAVEELQAAARGSAETSVDEGPLRRLLSESTAVSGVYTFAQHSFGLFTQEFCTLLLEELEHRATSGIPLRRPNGMNRFGCILNDIGFMPMLDGVVRDFIRPLAQMLFPDRIAGDDASDYFAFTVEYGKPEGGISGRSDQPDTSTFDVDLQMHRDASAATLNVCLGEGNFTGGSLQFKADDVHGGGFGQDSFIGGGEILMVPGLALMHRGQHRHAALPLTSGHRVNLIVWLFGEGGVVRVAPYSNKEQLNARQRWSDRGGPMK